MRFNRRVALAILFVVSLPAVTARIYASDEIQFFAFLRSLYFDRDLSFDNEYQHYDAVKVVAGNGFRETFLEDTTATGYRKTYATIGPALLWMPFYAVADVGVRVAQLAGSDVPRDGYSEPYVAAAAYGSALYGWLAVLIGWSIACRFVGHATGAAFAVAVGTPLFFYSYVAPIFSHATSAFAVAVLLAVWIHVRQRWTVRGAIGLGLAGALAATVREQDLLLTAIPACDFIGHIWRTRQSGAWAGRATVGGAGAVGFVLGYVPMAWSYLVLNGRLGPHGEVARKMSWTSPHAWDVVFSTAHGLAFWSPLVLVALIGLVRLAWPAAAAPDASNTDRRQIAVWLLVAVALTVYIAGSVESWTVAGAYGQRRFVSLTAVLIVGLASAFEWGRQGSTTRRGLVAATVLLSIWWTLGLAAAFGLHRMDRQRLELVANARTVFVDLPLEIPGLAWRYLTNRESLYRLPRQPAPE
jgi:hypothetical protein